MAIRALLVGDTTGGFPDAANDSCWVGHEAVEAGALGSLVDHLTLSVGSTGTFPGTGILAAVANAGKRRWAIGVDLHSILIVIGFITLQITLLLQRLSK